MALRSLVKHSSGQVKPVRDAVGLSAGQHFLFVEVPADRLPEDEAGFVARHEGARTVPLWNEVHRIGDRTLTGPNLEGISLACVSTDKDVYLEDDDTVTALVVDPDRPDANVGLELFCGSQPCRRATVHLDWNGMAVHTFGYLLAGHYRLQAGSASTSFEVAGYNLSASAGRVASSVLNGDTLRCSLDLSTLSRPATGRVRVTVLENGRPVREPFELESMDGVYDLSLRLDGEGPYVAHVAGIDDPSVDVQVPLRGTARKDVEKTWISALGVEFWASVLPMAGGRECRGLWLEKEGTNNSPLWLEDPIGEVGRIEARVAIEDLVLTMLHPGERRVQHRHVKCLEPGRALEFGVQPPFSVALVGGFVEGRPWEGLAALLPPSGLGLELITEKRARPRTELPVTIRTRRPTGEASVHLVVRDSRLKPMDAPATQLASGVKQGIELLTRERSPACHLKGRSSRSIGWLLGQTLVSRGRISQGALQQALSRQKQTGERLERILVEMRTVTERDLTEVLSSLLSVPFIDLSNYIIDPAHAKLVPEHIARRHQLIPINRIGNKLTVAMVDPLDVLAIDDVQLMTGLTVKAVVATPGDVNGALRDTYGAANDVHQAFGDIESDDLDALGELGASDAPIIRLCNLALTNAVGSGASGIVVEPGETEVEIRYRKDGAVHTDMKAPRIAQDQIARRFKTMAGLDLDETRRPQAGVARIRVDGRDFDLAVRTSPTAWGERISCEIAERAEGESAMRPSLFEGPASMGGFAGAPARSTGVRESFPQVLFAGIVRVRGEKRLVVPLGDTLGSFEVEAFAMHHGDWESASGHLDVVASTYGELTLPATVHPDDAVDGRLDVAWESTPVEISVTRDGQPVELSERGKPFSAGALTGPGRTALSFPAGPGRYECSVHEPTTGARDRCAKEVLAPGVFRGLSRTVRLLMPGEALSTEAAGALSLRVLRGPELPLTEICTVTAGYEHLCCEQTSAKILAAFGAYFTADSDQERQRVESIILSGVERERGLWVRGRGFKLYPDSPGVDPGWGKITVERLLSVSQLLEGRHLPSSLSDAVAALDEMARDLLAPYAIPLRPTDVTTMYDGYRAATQGSIPAQTLVKAIDERLDTGPGRTVVRGAHGEVQARVEACHAAATLLRIGSTETIRHALPVVDWIGRQRQANGGYYSTHDSAAAIMMLHELSRLALLGGANRSDRVTVDGRPMTVHEAADRADPSGRVEALDKPVIVEAELLREHDWTRFRSNLGVSVAIAGAGPDGALRPGDRPELCIEIEAYKAGDLVHVCLPPGLARIHGGGQVQSFSLDLKGAERVTVPLAVVGAMPGRAPVSRRYFVCVRNMFEEERIGNPGLMLVALAG